jgi:hypothetical protein
MITLELHRQNDDTAMLNHWDYRKGEDTCLRIFPDGTAQELFFSDDTNDVTEYWKPVDLATRLLELCKGDL